MGEGFAGEALALGYFVLVVREDEILTAAMDINSLAEVSAHHGGALDMPAGSALTPR